MTGEARALEPFRPRSAALAAPSFQWNLDVPVQLLAQLSLCDGSRSEPHSSATLGLEAAARVASPRSTALDLGTIPRGVTELAGAPVYQSDGSLPAPVNSASDAESGFSSAFDHEEAETEEQHHRSTDVLQALDGLSRDQKRRRKARHGCYKRYGFPGKRIVRTMTVPTPCNTGPIAPPRQKLMTPTLLMTGDHQALASPQKTLDEFMYAIHEPNQSHEHCRLTPARPGSSCSPVAPPGIHVFVDASNILIGFEETAKRKQGLDVRSQYRGPGMSFVTLALLMESQRSVSKRLMVGSSPQLLRWQHDAEALGYDVKIMDVVLKEVVHAGAGAAVAPSARQHVWGEHFVDEMLHLHMGYSVQSGNCGVMVVATGDGADTEYGASWTTAIELALRRGWCVELVTWRRSASRKYCSAAFQARWSVSFRIVFLDQYLPLLYQQDVAGT